MSGIFFLKFQKKNSRTHIIFLIRTSRTTINCSYYFLVASMYISLWFLSYLYLTSKNFLFDKSVWKINCCIHKYLMLDSSKIIASLPIFYCCIPDNSLLHFQLFIAVFPTIFCCMPYFLLLLSRKLIPAFPNISHDLLTHYLYFIAAFPIFYCYIADYWLLHCRFFINAFLTIYFRMALPTFYCCIPKYLLHLSR